VDSFRKYILHSLLLLKQKAHLSLDDIAILWSTLKNLNHSPFQKIPSFCEDLDISEKNLLHSKQKDSLIIYTSRLMKVDNTFIPMVQHFFSITEDLLNAWQDPVQCQVQFTLPGFPEPFTVCSEEMVK
jgi:hypothetical protein